MKIKKFPIKELSAELYMCIGSFSDIQAFSKLVIKENLDEDEYKDVRGICIDGGKRAVICCIIAENTPKKDYNSVLLHEVFHGIHYIFDHLGIDMAYTNTETMAHYLEYYQIEITKFIKEVENATRPAKKTTRARKRGATGENSQRA